MDEYIQKNINMGRISRAWRLMKASWKVFKLDKEMILFPVIASLISITIMGIFAVPIFLNPEYFLSRSTNTIWLLFFLAYLVLYFIGLFFNTAVIGSAKKRLKGDDPTFMDGIHVAAKNWKNLLLWSFISATVGIILALIRTKLKGLGKLIASIGGVFWYYATFFILPVIIIEDKNPIGSLKKSAKVFKDAWGETITGQIGFGIIFGFLGLAGILPIIIALLLCNFPMYPRDIMIATAGVLIGAVYWIIIGSIRNVLHNVYVFSLYQYATTGVLPDPYDSSMVPSMKTDSGREKLTEMRMCPKCGDSSFQIRDDGTAYCYNCGHSKKMELEDDKEDIRSFMD